VRRHQQAAFQALELVAPEGGAGHDENFAALLGEIANGAFDPFLLSTELARILSTVPKMQMT
jgi:hypothetical protein